MELKPINITMRVVFSRAIFESFGLFIGCALGGIAGFIMAFMYLAMGGQ